ncbi:MAG: YtxH domain-containing protein [Chitinophagaceae bacterium]|jgi:gas vesicle protein|nr:YtxH domain-containing protein [Chitinophagaceae bacterium]
MSDNQKILTGIVLGATAGVFITLFLQGSEGKKLLKNIKDTAQAVGEEVRDTSDTLEYNFGNMLRKGRNFIADITNKEVDVFSEIFS